MALYYSKNGLPFEGPPYTDEENWEFEQRLRRGGVITIIRQRHPARPEPSRVNDKQMENGLPMAISIQPGQKCGFVRAYRKLSVWLLHQNCRVSGIEAFEPNGI